MLPKKYWPIEIPGISSSFVFGWLGPLALVQNSRFLVCLPILGASREVFVSKKREVYSYCFKGGGRVVHNCFGGHFCQIWLCSCVLYGWFLFGKVKSCFLYARYRMCGHS